MSVTYGFYNSKNGDRRYDAIQMSSIFDGIICDGVIQHYGQAMIVKASSGMTITVGSGRAWFDHTWTLNDAVLPLTLSKSEVLLNRYDAVVIDVNWSDSVRANAIKIVKGTAASNPSKPTMASTSEHHQYPLAYIYVGAGATSISQGNITNCIGTSACPYVTAPLEKMEIDDLIAQWQSQWNQQLSIYKTSFNTWFNNLKDILDGNTEAKLAADILELQNKFDVLKNEYSFYDVLYDSNSDAILDSSGDTIEGRVIFQIK